MSRVRSLSSDYPATTSGITRGQWSRSLSVGDDPSSPSLLHSFEQRQSSELGSFEDSRTPLFLNELNRPRLFSILDLRREIYDYVIDRPFMDFPEIPEEVFVHSPELQQHYSDLRKLIKILYTKNLKEKTTLQKAYEISMEKGIHRRDTYIPRVNHPRSREFNETNLEFRSDEHSFARRYHLRSIESENERFTHSRLLNILDNFDTSLRNIPRPAVREVDNFLNHFPNFPSRSASLKLLRSAESNILEANPARRRLTKNIERLGRFTIYESEDAMVMENVMATMITVPLMTIGNLGMLAGLGYGIYKLTNDKLLHPRKKK